MKTKEQQKLPLAYKPLGLAGGAVSGMLFRQTWKALRKEDNPPTALDKDRRWGEILLAAAIQGAIVSIVRSVIERSGAKATERSTGSWPAGKTADAH
jgi:hypothetical protein